MIDVYDKVLEALKPIAPTYFDLFLDSKTETPCISYFEYGNVQHKESDILGWSNISFCIKVWGHKIKEVEPLSIKVDDAMKKLGFNRVSGNDMKENGLLCKILVYRALGWEKHKGE